MAFEETREQQQMYNYFRSCIYIFLIIEIIMNLPVTADNRVTQFVLDLLARFRVFNSVSGCKVAELICICIVCIGTKAEKSLKFNVRTMVIYPVLAGCSVVGIAPCSCTGQAAPAAGIFCGAASSDGSVQCGVGLAPGGGRAPHRWSRGPGNDCGLESGRDARKCRRRPRARNGAPPSLRHSVKE